MTSSGANLDSCMMTSDDIDILNKKYMDLDHDYQAILNLQNITEKLLLSMNLPGEIEKKYKFLKHTTFKNLNKQQGQAQSLNHRLTSSAPLRNKSNGPHPENDIANRDQKMDSGRFAQKSANV